MNITIEEFQAALVRCMAAEPPIDFALSKDSSLLVDVFAEMQFNKEPARSLEELNEKQRDAYMRWA